MRLSTSHPFIKKITLSQIQDLSDTGKGHSVCSAYSDKSPLGNDNQGLKPVLHFVRFVSPFEVEDVRKHSVKDELVIGAKLRAGEGGNAFEQQLRGGFEVPLDHEEDGLVDLSRHGENRPVTKM